MLLVVPFFPGVCSFSFVASLTSEYPLNSGSMSGTGLGGGEVNWSFLCPILGCRNFLGTVHFLGTVLAVLQRAFLFLGVIFGWQIWRWSATLFWNRALLVSLVPVLVLWSSHRIRAIVYYLIWSNGPSKPGGRRASARAGTHDRRSCWVGCWVLVGLGWAYVRLILTCYGAIRWRLNRHVVIWWWNRAQVVINIFIHAMYKIQCNSSFCSFTHHHIIILILSINPYNINILIVYFVRVKEKKIVLISCLITSDLPLPILLAAQEVVSKI